MALTYEKLAHLNLKTHPSLNEKWVQNKIAEDPGILNLGNVRLIDKERPQLRAGRLDLLLQEAEGNRRYEVEIQLGKVDESHIIRTLEYWDIERKKYRKYDHVAVIVAEDITSRFLNVISLFNGAIPLIAIQMRAVQFGDSVSLVFTTVLDQVQRGVVDDDDEEVIEVTDRAYWEARGSKETVAMADELLEVVKQLDPALELKYNKIYIGLARQGQADNFVVFRPQKNFIRVDIRLKKDDVIAQKIEAAGLDVMDYDKQWGRYRIRFAKGDVSKKFDVLKELFSLAS